MMTEEGDRFASEKAVVFVTLYELLMCRCLEQQDRIIQIRALNILAKKAH